MGRLDGKVAMITGGGHGQGRSHAVRLAEEGADIVLIDACEEMTSKMTYRMATEEDLADTARRVEKLGRRVLARRADVRDLAGLQAVVDEAFELFGHIEVVAANAGIISYGFGWEISNEEWDVIVDVNMKGVWHTVKAVVPKMIAADRGGSIIMTSSAAGIRGLPLMAHYTASKFGVVGLMKTFSNELAPYGIRVNSIHPTAVGADNAGNDADSFMGAVDEYPYQLFPRHPEIASGIGLNTLRDPALPKGAPFAPLPNVEPIDISNAVLWLASDESRYVTGVQLPVDGGTTNKA